MGRVLLVDDTPANRVLAEKLLRVAGHEVVVAETGAGALALARDQRPDLVLLDLGLPDIDGWEILRRLRGGAETRALRIVALTAHAMVGDRERALAAGFDGYMSKPIDVTTFAQIVIGYMR